MRNLAVIVVAVLTPFALASPAPAAHGGGQGNLTEHFARQTLPPNDGWAASGAGTTGGSAAATITTVQTRDQLAAAVAGDSPKIVLVKGVIEGPACDGLADPAYSLEAFLAAYDPAVWGRVNPSGPLEEARLRSVANQKALTEIKVGPNTTIVGARGATLKRLTLMIDRAPNVIVRNLNLQDAADCFPRWSPTDGSTGNWNSEYDLISVRRSTNVWIDHCTFSDGDNPDSNQPVHFGRPYQVHDGALDITHTANLVTVSWNVFTNHDKTMLIGSSDTVGPDVGLLNVTLHHNVFDGVGQRIPRVRFGKVDLYNNYYKLREPFDYAVGVGIQSAVYMENNYFRLAEDVPTDTILRDWKGTTLTEIGSRVNGQPVSLLDAYNATHDPDFGSDAGWTPVLRAHAPHPTVVVPILTRFLAGAH
ncbi:pectate lyase family protein [Allorhizocola rhizosphaerae]|uniref:pectate lyase family protein n=1 Tax=Allorhizocola rhizosphaerae TaxID=1872709 RepID=UPI000E3B6C8B|nr:pectate lyase [Allorhizocola rhizosphaerae]